MSERRVVSGKLVVEFAADDGSTSRVEVSVEGFDEERAYDVIRSSFAAATESKVVWTYADVADWRELRDSRR